MRIILGSQSPRRKKILNDAGYVIEVLPAYFDEESLRHEDPCVLTQLLAAAKNKVLQEKVSGKPCIVTADTVVTCDGRIYEKAQSVHEAYEWISRFMGGGIEVYTSHVIHDVESGYEASHTAAARVSFSVIPEDVRQQLALNAYNASVAGGFNISDPLLRPYATIEGDEASILGMDIAWVQRTLIHIEKIHVRTLLKELYKAHDLTSYVESACKAVESDEQFQRAERVYAYQSIVTLEIPFIEVLVNSYPHKQWVYPDVRDGHIVFPHTETDVGHVYVLVPALALTPTGSRLGKGKGMYDVFLAEHPELCAYTCSVVPDFAFMPLLPTAQHDVTISRVYAVKIA